MKLQEQIIFTYENIQNVTTQNPRECLMGFGVFHSAQCWKQKSITSAAMRPFEILPLLQTAFLGYSTA